MDDITLAIISAVLSVLMTASATFFLLDGQTKAEQKKNNQTEIFKERLKSYNQFLSALGNYVENPQDKNLESRLKFRTSALAMHTNPHDMININRNVKEIIGMAQQDNESNILKTLFDISKVFNTILYEHNKENGVNSPQLESEYEKSIIAISNKLESTLEEVSEVDITSEDIKEQEEIEKENIPAKKWNEFKNNIELESWHIDDTNDVIKVNKPGINTFIRIRKPSKNQFYIVEVINEDDDNDFVRKIKSKHKGNIRGGRWFRDLTSLPSYGIKNGTLVNAIESNDKARAVIIKWIEKLINEIP